MTRAGWWLGLSVSALLSCSSPTGSSSPPARAASAPHQGASGACVVSGPEICYNARDDNCNGPIDEGCGVDGGLVQFMIAWDESNADVDLDVTDPRGRVVELGRASDSGLLRDRDCPGKDQECRGINIENVTLVAPDKLLRGTYIVRVRLERWNQVDMPVRVNLAARLGAKAFFVQLKLEREKQERRFELVL